jgi:hypothetical protein
MTRNWGAWKAVSLYLDRCKVDTPNLLVGATWAHVSKLRPKIGKVVDFGAGDGRFAKAGSFKKYVGYEIDPDCRYSGPFSESAPYYWREDVDVIIYEAGASLTEEDFDGFGDFNRAAMELLLEREFTRHVCQRAQCGGRKGGFLCPFTHRPVCERADCSVLSSSWIPQGADLSRVEREYYDEWAPLLGL